MKRKEPRTGRLPNKMPQDLSTPPDPTMAIQMEATSKKITTLISTISGNSALQWPPKQALIMMIHLCKPSALVTDTDYLEDGYLNGRDLWCKDNSLDGESRAPTNRIGASPRNLFNDNDANPSNSGNGAKLDNSKDKESNLASCNEKEIWETGVRARMDGWPSTTSPWISRITASGKQESIVRAVNNVDGLRMLLLNASHGTHFILETQRLSPAVKLR